MTTCPACGANVTRAIDVNTDEQVLLEPYTEAATESPRYRVVETAQPVKVERVAQQAVGSFFPAHSAECPYGER